MFKTRDKRLEGNSAVDQAGPGLHVLSLYLSVPLVASVQKRAEGSVHSKRNSCFCLTQFWSYGSAWAQPHPASDLMEVQLSLAGIYPPLDISAEHLTAPVLFLSAPTCVFVLFLLSLWGKSCRLDTWHRKQLRTLSGYRPLLSQGLMGI